MTSIEKINQLQQWGVLNTNPQSIKAPLFNQYSFFDPYDSNCMRLAPMLRSLSVLR
jgi:hypothetical protein